MMPDGIGKGFEVWSAALIKKSSAGRGSNGKTTAYGVKKLRELILELAVMGKLVPQDNVDEPASEQLKRIAAQKLRLTRASRVTGGGASNTDLESLEKSLPHGWEATPLGDIVDVLNGRAYSKGELLDAGTPVLRVGNLFTSNHWYYSDLDLDPDKYCSEGDLIFAWSASFGPFIWPGPKVIYHYHIWKLDFYSRNDVYRDYLYWFLQNKTQEIKRAGHGVSMVHMTKAKMEKLTVALPPLAEQHRIVAKVDELMALCDALEAEQSDSMAAHARLVECLLGTLTAADDAEDFAAAWRRIADHFDTLFTTEHSIDQLKQCILQLAVMGKLVPQDAGKCDDWPIVTLKEMSEQITDGEHATPTRTSSGVPLATAKNVRDGYLDISSTDFVTEATADKCWMRCKPKHNDILMVCVGATTGRVCLAENPPDMVLVRSVALIRPNQDKIMPPFLNLLLRSPAGAYFGTSSPSETADRGH